MKKLKYLLFVLPFLFCFNVFADDFNVSSSITSPSGSPSAGGYEGLEIYNSGSTNRYAINTRYNGRLSRIRFNVPLPNNWPDGECFSSGDLNYTLTLKMATNDWRNNFGTIFISNNSSGTNWFTSFTYISRQQIKINFKIPTTESCYDFLYVDIQSKNLSSTAFTGETNWDLKSVVLTANFPSSGGGSGGSGSSGATNQDIINNNNQNTQDIINNNNQNTQDIINNNNDNTQQIIEGVQNGAKSITDNIDKQFMNCTSQIPKYITSFSGHIYGGYAGMYFNPSNANILVYEVPEVGKEYSLVFNNGVRLRIGSSDTLFTSITDVKLNYVFVNDNPVVGNTYSFNVYNKYIYINMYGHNQGTSNSSDLTFNGLQVCTNRLDDTNNYLQDDSDPTINDSALNEVFGKVHFTDPLGYLLTLPTQLINQIVSMSDTCSAIDLGTLYGVHLTLPCINLENYLGSDLWNILDIILSVGLLSVIFKNFYDTISNLLTLGGQKEAKEKFSMPTPMDFLAMILGGDKG